MGVPFEALTKSCNRSFQKKFNATNGRFMNEPSVSALCPYCRSIDKLVFWEYTTQDPAAVPISWGFCTSCKERGPYKTIKNGTDYQPTSTVDSFVYNSQIDFSKQFVQHNPELCFELPRAPEGCEADFLARLLLDEISGQQVAFAGLIGFARMKDIKALGRSIVCKTRITKLYTDELPAFVFPFGPKPGKAKGFYAYTPIGTRKYYLESVHTKKKTVAEYVFLCTGNSNRMYIRNNWSEALALSAHYANTCASVALKLPADDFQVTRKKPLTDIVRLRNIPVTFT